MFKISEVDSFVCGEVLVNPVNPMESFRARSVYLTTLLPQNLWEFLQCWWSCCFARFANSDSFSYRLTPVYMLVLLVYTTLVKYLGSGPMWTQEALALDNCAKSWWTNLLYINNFVKVEESVGCSHISVLLTLRVRVNAKRTPILYMSRNDTAYEP